MLDEEDVEDDEEDESDEDVDAFNEVVFMSRAEPVVGASRLAAAVAVDVFAVVDAAAAVAFDGIVAPERNKIDDELLLETGEMERELAEAADGEASNRPPPGRLLIAMDGALRTLLLPAAVPVAVESLFEMEFSFVLPAVADATPLLVAATSRPLSLILLVLACVCAKC
jgi:hypothetical protein